MADSAKAHLSPVSFTYGNPKVLAVTINLSKYRNIFLLGGSRTVLLLPSFFTGGRTFTVVTRVLAAEVS